MCFITFNSCIEMEGVSCRCCETLDHFINIGITYRHLTSAILRMKGWSLVGYLVWIWLEDTLWLAKLATPKNISGFIVYFTLIGTITYKMKIMLCWQRLEISDWNHILIWKRFGELINKMRSGVIFSLAYIKSDIFLATSEVAPLAGLWPYFLRFFWCFPSLFQTQQLQRT